jgi:bisanhydrobacterioruberin hydratase
MKFTEKNALILVLVLHTVGIAGVLIQATRHYFVPLSPLIIVLSLVAAIYPQFKFTLQSVFLFSGILFTGFLIEVLGVKSGLIFGEYTYGNTLGPKVLGVPLVIGLNWLALAFYTNQIRIRGFSSILPASLIGAGLMTFFDFVLEPVAVKLDFWHWDKIEIPLQNYAAWFVLSWFFQWSLIKFCPEIKVGNGRWIFLIQLIFFLTLRFIL